MANTNDEYYSNIIELINNNFLGIFFSLESELLKGNREYKLIHEEICKIKDDYPVLTNLVECTDDTVALTFEDNKALSRYLYLISERELIQTKEAYFRGHKDNYAYLKKLEVI